MAERSLACAMSRAGLVEAEVIAFVPLVSVARDIERPLRPVKPRHRRPRQTAALRQSALPLVAQPLARAARLDRGHLEDTLNWLRTITTEKCSMIGFKRALFNGCARGAGRSRSPTGMGAGRRQLSHQADPLHRRVCCRRRQRPVRAARGAEALREHRAAGDHREQARRRRSDGGGIRQPSRRTDTRVIVAATGQMAIAAAIYPKLPYHPTRIRADHHDRLVSADPRRADRRQIKSVKDLIAYGKANPGKSNYATSSPAFTITTELFKLKSGMPAQAIPTRAATR